MKKVIVILVLLIFISLLNARPVVMLTGYWSPTSEMIFRFSDNPILNPDGWIGENWEGRGYDVYAFFPAIDVRTREFEVDYQATWNDFWTRVEEFHPEIMINFGAGDGPWEIETKAINRSNWYPDDIYPYYPTPNPPDSTIAVNAARYSTLPIVSISDAVNEQTDVLAWIDEYGDPGDFLCNYIAYLGMWYQSMHSNEDDEYYCKAAGFIHVDGFLPIDDATVAAEVTLRTTLEYYENLTDLTGIVLGDSPLENCEITLTAENDQTFVTTSDENGNFIFEDILFGEYTLTAILGRYYYYRDEFVLDSHDTYLTIEMEEYNPSDPLTYNQGANELISENLAALVQTAAYFPPEMLIPFQDHHLNSLRFTAPENSDDCASYLFLYRGDPMADNLDLLFTIILPDFQQGEIVEAWLNDIYFLTEEDLQDGLTMAFALTTPNNNIGYSDNTIANPNGNLIKIGPTWFHADEEFDIQGNWDLELVFYGTTAVNSPEDVINIYDIQLSNYPNPFNPSTTIRFDIPASIENASLKIYNIKGQVLKNFTNVTNKSSVIWDGTDIDNEPVSSGLYFYSLFLDDTEIVTNKMLLIK